MHLRPTFSFRLTPWVNRTLYKQIINWVVFGTLFDPKREFFIQLKLPETIHSSGKMVLKLDNSRHHQKYVVDYSLVPSHFSAALTERILFIGYAVGILTNSESKIIFAFILVFCTKS